MDEDFCHCSFFIFPFQAEPGAQVFVFVMPNSQSGAIIPSDIVHYKKRPCQINSAERPLPNSGKQARWPKSRGGTNYTGGGIGSFGGMAINILISCFRIVFRFSVSEVKKI